MTSMTVHEERGLGPCRTKGNLLPCQAPDVQNRAQPMARSLAAGNGWQMLAGLASK